MFGKKASEDGDIKLLLSELDRIANGDFSETNEDLFEDKSYALKINSMINAFKKSNNFYVMRMNETVGALGDNTLIKETFDQVNELTESIDNYEGFQSGDGNGDREYFRRDGRYSEEYT